MSLTVEQRIVLDTEVERIGLQLIESRICVGDDQAYWKTLTYRDNQYFWQETDSLYSGVAGIALFLLELYLYTKKNIFWDIVLKAANWLEARQTVVGPLNSYSFFTGRTGVSYFFLKMYEATGEAKYNKEAINTALNGIDIPNLSFNIYDLLNGISGVLLGLAQIYSRTYNKLILKELERLLGVLISNTKLSNVGIYWDRNQDCIKSLCGFSHGASGIAFVLDELAHYFSIPITSDLALHGRAYENQFYDPLEKNWPDFRNAIHDQKTFLEHQTAYQEGNFHFFKTPKYMNAWCHGALGNAFARLRLNDLSRTSLAQLNSPSIWESNFDYNSSYSIETENFTICHGMGAVIDYNLLVYSQTYDEHYFQVALKLTIKMITFRENHGFYINGFGNNSIGEDLSLFMGISGIGYTILRLLNNFNTPSILLPTLIGKDRPILKDYDFNSITFVDSFSATKVNMALCHNIFPKSLIILSKYLPPAALENSFNIPISAGDKIPSFFEGILSALIQQQDEQLKYCLEDIFSFEKTKYHYDMDIDSYSLLNIERSLQQSEVFAVYDHSCNYRNDILFSFNPRNIIHICRFDWSELDDGTKIELNSKEQGNFTVILMPSPEYIEEYWLNDITATLLNIFINPISFEEAMIKFLHIENLSHLGLINLKNYFCSQFNILLQMRLLLTNYSYEKVKRMLEQ